MKQGLNQVNVFIINSNLGETVPLSATATSSNVAFSLPSSIANYDVMVTNAGPSIAFVTFGTSSATTATLPGTNGTNNATPVLAGAIYNFSKNTDAVKSSYCAAICPSGGTATVYFTSIQGS